MTQCSVSISACRSCSLCRIDGRIFSERERYIHAHLCFYFVGNLVRHAYVLFFFLEDDENFPLSFHYKEMPMKRGHVSAPQNTFIDTIIRKFDSQSMLIFSRLD